MKEKFTEGVIKELIRQELDKWEEKGMELTKKYFDGKITEEEYKNKFKVLKGYRVWWGVEAKWVLTKVEVDYVKKLKEGLYEISTACKMEYLSSHQVAGFDESSSSESIAAIKMKIDDVLQVKEFSFHWK
jgi:hypothetical protein